MNWLFFAILAYFIAAIVSVLDKVILNVAIPKPLTYAAWVGIFGIYGLILVPFGFHLGPLIQAPILLFLSVGSGAIFIFGLYFLFSAISLNEVSRIGPLFGALTAIWTLIFSRLLLAERLDNIHLIAFFLLLFGGIVISLKFQDIKSLSPKSVILSLVGSALFAFSFVLIKIAYERTEFLNAFVMGRMGEVLAGILLFCFSFEKHQAETRYYLRSLPKKSLGLFVANKTLAGVFFLLQNYAVFLGSAALVQALSGLRYAFLLLLTMFLSFRFPRLLFEKISCKAIAVKAVAIALIILGLTLLAFSERPADLAPGLKTFGVTFSKKAAIALGLDWQKTYLAVLDELGAKKLRLAVYWDELEGESGQYDFSDLDWQVNEAEKRRAKIILAVGERLPRWPECHIPKWAENLPEKERQLKILDYIEVVVKRYKKSPIIEYWQVENEPFLPRFGICPAFDSQFLDEELALVRALDERPVIVSDSGELSVWLAAARRADVFGTTMYRTIWSPKLPGDGYLDYPLPPSFFHLKANLIKYFAGAKDIIVVELQAEPWGPKAVWEMSPAERDVSLSSRQFKENIAYAREVGFKEAYLWGAEWWYWEKLNGRPEFWELAKTLF